MKSILPADYYRSNDVVALSRNLLGKFLVTELDHQYTAGMIVETEAYKGPEDQACHAYNNRRTPRTEVMFQAGGAAYVYLCYGIHHLFNVVTGESGLPHAVLIRGLEPVDGIDIMLERRGRNDLDFSLCGGPGSLARALGISTRLSGEDLTGNRIWIEDRGIRLADREIIAGTRVGVESAGASASLPWRFMIKGSRWTSPVK